MSYYENQQPQQQWPAGQSGWDHQTPPVRSGASSTVPREESAAFVQQIEEVDRAIDNLVKSGKMFGMAGRHGRGGGNMGRSHSHTDYGDQRGGHQSNLQNFYASQRQQSSRGSNEAEQAMQAKRRLAAQRERELRNYHQEQQYNRTVSSEVSPYGSGNSGSKAERANSPGNVSEDERRDLIARQRSALYREGPFAETGGYIDETGTPRPGIPGSHTTPGGLRGPSPLAYEYGRTPPAEGNNSGAATGSHSAGPTQRSRANSNASPQSNPAGHKGVFDAPNAAQQQSSRTSNSSPGGSPGTKAPGGNPVAPIGTRPSVSNASGSGMGSNSALNKAATSSGNNLPSPLSHGYSAPGSSENVLPTTSGAPSNPSSASAEGSMGLGWGGRPGVWGNSKSGLSQASVWG